MYYQIRDKTRAIADQHANLGRTIDGSIVQHLQKLRVEIKDMFEGDKARGVTSHREYIPVLTLTFGEGLQAWLGGGKFHVSQAVFYHVLIRLAIPGATTIESLRAQPYNPEWRKFMNKKGVAPPAVASNFKNALDVEHKFD